VSELVARVRRRYRYPAIIMGAMVSTDFKLRYQASVLGYLWTLLKPLGIFTVLYIVFALFLKFASGIPYYAVYLLFGIAIWGLFADATSQGATSLVGRADLLRKIAFPRYVVVLSVGVSALITFGLTMVVIVFFMVVAQVPLTANVLWLAPLFVELAALSLSVGLFLSGLYVRYRDVSYIWDVALQAGFYASPIIYPLTMVPTAYAKYLLLNPMAQIIQDARYALFSDRVQTVSTEWGTPWMRLVPVGLVVVLSVGSVLYFKHRSPHFAEEA
jgi:ABC-2 type transport system permease protein